MTSKKEMLSSEVLGKATYLGYLLFGASLLALAYSRENIATALLVVAVAVFLLGGLSKVPVSGRRGN